MNHMVPPYSIREASRHKANSELLELILKDAYRAQSAWVYSGFFFVITVLYSVLLWLLPYLTTDVPSLMFSFWRSDFWEWSNAVWFTPGFVTFAFVLLALARTKNEALNFAVQNEVLDNSDLHNYEKTQTWVSFIETILVVCVSILAIYIFFVKNYI